ncbi:hypothetical protein ACQ4PT_011229 [Festuca glaucescens]
MAFPATQWKVPSPTFRDQDREQEPRRWAAIYMTQLQQKNKAFYDGSVLLHPDNRRLVLLDDAGVTIDAKVLSTSESISVGTSIEFPCHLVEVGEVIPTQCGGGAKTEVVGAGSWIWKVSYTTKKDLDRGRMKNYDGTMKYWSSNGWIVLLNAKEEPIAVQILSVGQCVKPDSKVNFSHHSVRVGPLLSGSPSEEVPTASSLKHYGEETQYGGSGTRLEDNISTHVGIPQQSGNTVPPIDVTHCMGHVQKTVPNPLLMSLDFSDGQAFRSQVHVDEVQPASIFGLGYYRLRSPAARAALVAHVPYQLQNGFFVCFVNHDDRDNHRAVQGFRSGWLMFLAIPLDFRNEYDISNAIGAFGRFHHWHQDENMIERTLVYASFPSPALVPRDVVFGDYATIGGVRETWTAICYILTADFADMLPHDEDQMPVDGNPHPLPGQLHPGNFDWVMPQFPEIGWNNVPLQQQPANVHDADFFQPEEQVVDHVQNNEQEVDDLHGDDGNAENDVAEIQIDDSIVLNGSQGSSMSNSLAASVNDNLNHNIIINTVRCLHAIPDFSQQFPQVLSCRQLISDRVFGTLLPPAMQKDRFLKCFLPSLIFDRVPESFPPMDVFSTLFNTKGWVDDYKLKICPVTLPILSQVSAVLFLATKQRKRTLPTILSASESIAVRTRASSKKLSKVSDKLSVMPGRKKRQRTTKKAIAALIFTQGIHHSLEDMSSHSGAVSETSVR